MLTYLKENQNKKSQPKKKTSTLKKEEKQSNPRQISYTLSNIKKPATS